MPPPQQQGVECYSLSASGYTKTTRGGVTPKASRRSNVDLSTSKQTVRAHQAEVHHLLSEIENLTRQRTELLLADKMSRDLVMAERRKRMKAERRLHRLRAKSEATVSLLLAREAAVCEELRFAYDLLGERKPPQGSAEGGPRRVPYATWVRGVREGGGGVGEDLEESILDDLLSDDHDGDGDNDGHSEYGVSFQGADDGGGDDAKGSEPEAKLGAAASAGALWSSRESNSGRRELSVEKREKQGPPSLRFTNHWVEQDAGTPEGRDAWKRGQRVLSAKESKARAGSARSEAAASPEGRRRVDEAIERDRCE